MATYSHTEEIPFPLVRRGGRRPLQLERDDGGFADLSAIPRDRMAPSVAGALVGFVGGLAALGVVHAVQSSIIGGPVADTALARGVATPVAFGVAYVTAGAVGALVGAAFAVVTRYLRKWFPLFIWALVFFPSLGTLLVALSTTYGRGLPPSLPVPILVASGVFGCLLSFSLPIRRCRC